MTHTSREKITGHRVEVQVPVDLPNLESADVFAHCDGGQIEHNRNIITRKLHARIAVLYGQVDEVVAQLDVLYDSHATEQLARSDQVDEHGTTGRYLRIISNDLSTSAIRGEGGIDENNADHIGEIHSLEERGFDAFWELRGLQAQELRIVKEKGEAPTASLRQLNLIVVESPKSYCYSLTKRRLPEEKPEEAMNEAEALMTNVRKLLNEIAETQKLGVIEPVRFEILRTEKELRMTMLQGVETPADIPVQRPLFEERPKVV